MAGDGTVHVTVDGAVIENVRITGCVIVRANRVTIRSSRIDCRGYFGIRFVEGFRGGVVDRVTVHGGDVTDIGIVGEGFILRAVDVSHVVDGVRLGSATRVARSYIHHLVQPEGAHSDAVQTLGGTDIAVVGNNLQAYNPETGRSASAVYQTGRLSSPLRKVLVEGNLMNGGGWSVNAGHPSSQEVSDVVFRGNEFERNCAYGAVVALGSGTTWASTNVWRDDRRPVIERNRQCASSGRR